MQHLSKERMERLIEHNLRLIKARRLRVKRFLKPLPRRANIERYPIIKRFSAFAKRHQFFWSYKPNPVRAAFYVGSIITLMPFLGLQIIIAFALAWLFKANLTISIGLQFLSNVFTAAPIYFMTYTVGRLALQPFVSIDSIEIKVYAVLLGGLLCGLVIGYLLNSLYQWTILSHRKRVKHNHQLTAFCNERIEP